MTRLAILLACTGVALAQQQIAIDALEGAAMPLLQVAKLFPDIYLSVPAPLSVALAMRPHKPAARKSWLESEDTPTRRAAEQRLAAATKK